MRNIVFLTSLAFGLLLAPPVRGQTTAPEDPERLSRLEEHSMGAIVRLGTPNSADFSLDPTPSLRLEEVRAEMKRFRPAGFNDWFKPPKPSRVPDEAEASSRLQRILALDGGLVFIDQGRVFERTANGALRHLEGSRKVKAIVRFSGGLAALQGDGDIHLWDEKARAWIGIGDSAQELRAAGAVLVALTDEGKVRVYRGTPGPPRVELTYIPENRGGVIVMIPYPRTERDNVAFKDTGIRDAARLEEEGGTTFVVFLDGRRVPFQEFSLPPQRALDETGIRTSKIQNMPE